MIGTLRDYKNQDFKDREFSMPAVIRNGTANKMYLESHQWSQLDRATWVSSLYEIEQPAQILKTFGLSDRRTLYFKQFAKFASDVNAVGFSIHKNLMYKSLTRKNYEHVISLRFDRG